MEQKEGFAKGEKKKRIKYLYIVDRDMTLLYKKGLNTPYTVRTG